MSEPTVLTSKKTHPYRVPEGFFDASRAEILARAKSRQRLTRRRNFWLGFTIAGAAACAALIVTLGITTHIAEPVQATTPHFNDVAQAFDNLSETDRQFLLEIYDNDYLSLIETISTPHNENIE